MVKNNRFGNMPASTNGMNMQCIVCPTQPSFSDLSHLLTHLASKGHLSKQFDVQLKASTDPAAANNQARFEQWMLAHNLKPLLKDRMEQKEAKKNGAGRRANNTSRARSTTASSTSRSTTAGSQSLNRQLRTLRENTLDPQLSPLVKTEDQSRSITPFTLDAASAGRSYAPMMGGHAASPYAVGSAMQESSILDSLTATSSEDSPYPATGRRRKARKTKHNRSITEIDSIDDLQHGDGTGRMESVQLTGFGFPGVYRMDAATEEGKRMRNQKKDESALVHLQNVSQSISPKEKVYVNFEQRREREITGAPNSDDGLSVLSGEGRSGPPSSPPKKKQRASRKPRAVLQKKQTNQTMQGNPYQNAMTFVPKDQNEFPGQFDGFLPRIPYGSDIDVNDGMTYGQPTQQHHGGIRIHNDNSGPAITFNNGPPMGVLTSGLQQVAQNGPFASRGPPVYAYGDFGGVSKDFAGGAKMNSNFVLPSNTTADNIFCAASKANSGRSGNTNPSTGSSNVILTPGSSTFGAGSNSRFSAAAADELFGPPLATGVTGKHDTSNFPITNIGSFGNLNNLSLGGTFGNNPLTFGGVGRRQAPRADPMKPHHPYVHPNAVERPTPGAPYTQWNTPNHEAPVDPVPREYPQAPLKFAHAVPHWARGNKAGPNGEAAVETPENAEPSPVFAHATPRQAPGKAAERSNSPKLSAAHALALTQVCFTHNQQYWPVGTARPPLPTSGWVDALALSYRPLVDEDPYAHDMTGLAPFDNNVDGDAQINHETPTTTGMEPFESNAVPDASRTPQDLGHDMNADLPELDETLFMGPMDNMDDETTISMPTSGV